MAKLFILTWGLLFNHGVKRTRKIARIFNCVTMSNASYLIGTDIFSDNCSWLGGKESKDQG